MLRAMEMLLQREPITSAARRATAQSKPVARSSTPPPARWHRRAALRCHDGLEDIGRHHADRPTVHWPAPESTFDAIRRQALKPNGNSVGMLERCCGG
jgi:hypothetical protein